MIRPESFAASTEDFAANRRTIHGEGAGKLRGAVREALARLGLPSWELQIVDAAREVFDTAVQSETDTFSQVIDDMRDLFALRLAETLQETKRSDNPEVQLETITNWVTAYAINAGTEAATTADPDDGVGLEWVSMDDSNVREPHREAHGQVVPTGQAFSVGGVEMMFPGEPVGDPSNWINCRCMARPTMLTEASAQTITAAAGEADADVSRETEKEVFTSATIMALPADTDPVTAASSEPDGAHCTLLFLGETSALDRDALANAIGQFVQQGGVTAVTDTVNGRATLGAKSADVVLLDAANLIHIRNGLLEQDTIAEAHQSVEQFPTWIPHVTLGYPEAPAAGEFTGESITFDRIALWFGEDRTAVFPLTGAEQATPDAPEESLLASAFVAQAPALEAAPEEEEPDDTQVEMDSLIDAESAFPDVPWYGVLAPEGLPSGDKRQFALNSLSSRDLPLPLKFQFIDDEGHKGSFPVGRIDRIWREDGLIKAEGVFDTSDQAYEVIRLLANQIMRGVSVDLDAVEGSVGEDKKTVNFSEGRISSATVCSIPAFAQAFVSIGRWADVNRGEAQPDVSRETGEFDLVPPRTMDGPGWITDPTPTHRITSYWVDGRGAAKIGWGAPGDFNRCRTQLAKYVQNPAWLSGLCANLHYRALGAWPGQASLTPEALTRVDEGEARDIALVASAAPKISADFFRNPGLDKPTPLTLGEDGHIFGHLAAWEACHIGFEICTSAPPSETDYGYFLTGQVFTDAGPVAVGQVTLGGGHADQKLKMRAAMAHYDNVATAVADITVGEDLHGIWFSGRLRDWITPKQIHELFAAGLSGDWRGVRFRGRKSMELIAAHAVNVQGFPIPRNAQFAMEGTDQTSLIAAGFLQPAPLTDPARIQELSKLKAAVREWRVADIRKQLTSLKGN